MNSEGKNFVPWNESTGVNIRLTQRPAQQEPTRHFHVCSMFALNTRSKRQRLNEPDDSEAGFAPSAPDFMGMPPAAPTRTTSSNLIESPDSISRGSGRSVTSPRRRRELDELEHNASYIASQEELRSLIITTAQSTAPTREVSLARGESAEPDVAPDPGPEHDQMKQILSQGRRLEYLKNYIGQVAPWLDMFDGNRTFGTQVPVLARSSPALLYAMLALSARQMERKMDRKQGRHNSYDSLELYQEAIRLLTPLLEARDQKAIPICVILCCLEMMSASAQDWRKHLEGCAALFDAFGVNGFSDSLLRAVFWCYVRMDLCGALIADGTQGTLLHPSQWLPGGVHESQAKDFFLGAESPDMYANYAVYLCAKVCELVANRTKYTELGEDNGCSLEVFTECWQYLYDDLQNWIVDRPAELLPVETLNTRPFPRVLYVHWAAISSNQLYHTASIILLETMPKSLESSLESGGSTLRHAMLICGISLTNPHQGCLNNALQPLWIAGRLLTHRAEHALIVNLIREIENSTGWATCWRIPDLESAWGYKIKPD